MAKAKKTTEQLPTMFGVKHDAARNEHQLVTDTGEVVRVFKTQTKAERLCDLLNAAYTLFERDEKSQGLDKPTVKVQKKAKAK